MINCPYCGKLTDPKLDACPHCGGRLQRSSKATQPPGRKPRGRQTCPNCKALVQEGDIICVVCGTNLLTGQKISDESPPRAGRAANRWLIIAAVVLVIVLLIGALWYYVSTRDPVNQALRLKEQGEFAEAQDLLTEYVQRVPDDERALYQLGLLQFRHSMFQEAAQSFEQAASIDPDNVDAALWGVIALQNVSSESNVVNRQRSLLQQVVREDPDNVPAWYLLALAEGVLGNTNEQISALEQVAQRGNDELSVDWPMGLGYALAGNYPAAESELLEFAERNPDPEAHAALGFVDSLSGDSNAAIASLSSAAAGQTPSVVHWEVLTQLGKLLLEQGRYNEAIPHLQRAAELRPTAELPAYLLGLAYLAQGNSQQAMQRFETLSRGTGEYAALSAVQSAHINLLRDEPVTAQEAIERAERQGANGADFHTVRGRVLAAQGANDAAQTAFRQAINRDP
ncbi:MAG: tetratricopeptide repeat protein, partial [Candidatus Hydrogenedentales bacterium]